MRKNISWTFFLLINLIRKCLINTKPDKTTFDLINKCTKLLKYFFKIQRRYLAPESRKTSSSQRNLKKMFYILIFNTVFIFCILRSMAFPKADVGDWERCMKSMQDWRLFEYTVGWVSTQRITSIVSDNHEQEQ